MFDDRTNLLPYERIQALRRNYLARLGIVGMLLIALLACVAAVLLVPAYLYLAAAAHTKEAQLASLEATLSSADSRVSERMQGLAGSLATLTALSATPAASTVLRTALAVPHPGIALTAFAYAPAAKKKGTLAITGIAATRDALRSYQLALENEPLFTAASLPVSAYAKEVDSIFTITLTLAP